MLVLSSSPRRWSLARPVNGLLLDYEPERMSAQIARFLDSGLPPFAPGAGCGLNRRQYAERLLAIYERMAADETPIAAPAASL